jgi:hypothetical protein
MPNLGAACSDESNSGDMPIITLRFFGRQVTKRVVNCARWQSHGAPFVGFPILLTVVDTRIEASPSAK